MAKILQADPAARGRGPMSRKRSFLFLQGVCSPFFARLGAQLAADGHRVVKINFTGGDVAYWRMRPALLFRGTAAELPAFLDEQYRRFGITDQILFGDRRPVHRPAVKLAANLGIRTHVFEEGYFRPYWVTLEREGVNRHSLLPRDAAWFYDIEGRVPEFSAFEPFHAPFRVRAAHDVAYHVASAVNPVLVPRYSNHAPVNAAIEYAAYVRRFSLLRMRRRKDNELVHNLIGRSCRFYVLPLQLDGDAQIRDHSRFRGIQEAISFVIKSFRHAPSDSRLVIKNHPLDAGLVAYEKIVSKLCKQSGLAGRVDYLETGDLVTLIRHARGVVTVNSTVGAVALELNCPTIALGPAIYNIPGLTFQGVLDDFWKLRRHPDAELFRRFRNTVIHATQVNGGFYCSRGIALAVGNSCRRLTADRSPLEELLL